jgi:signal transduction histidine kinase
VKEAMKAKEAQKRSMPSNQLKYIFESLPDSVIACDGEGKILRANAAALTLFEVPSEGLCRGIDYQQFLHRYTTGDDPQQVISLEPWLMSLLIDGEAVSSLREEIMVLQLPSGRKAYITRCSSPPLDARKQAVGSVSVFHDITHRYQKALHLQRVHDAVSILTEAIAHVPEHLDFAFPEGTIGLLSPPVLFVAQQLVDVIRHVLDCQHVSLLALGPADHLYYAVGSGLTPEQEEYHRATGGHLLPSDFVGETALARLAAGQEVMLSTDRLRLPPEMRAVFGAGNLLLVPLFLEQQWVGGLVIAKAGLDSGYTPEEIELVKAVATETMLVIECLLCLCGQAEERARALAHHEMSLLINEFLNLAGHELNTPLTAIKGNIQLAQRRLATLKRQLAGQHGRVNEQLEQVQHTLASATQGTRLQERIIKALLDDARIQSHTLEVHPTRLDLSVLLREAVATQQRLVPERTIVLENMSPENGVPVMADAERITQVINNYLANALIYSPVDQPVTVQLRVEGAVACVSVHDEGPGIPGEEQGRIWGRFYFAKGSAVQHELDLGLGLGLGLYLSRAFVEGHHGSVGVQSDPGHGATFWFTLPVEADSEGRVV